jgi:hypothetical protein
MFGRKKKDTRIKKQVVLQDEELWNRLKGKLQMQGKTISEWFEEQARKELYHLYE